MNSKQKQVYILGLLILLLFVINYNFLDKQLIKFIDKKETAIVKRIIDGDTIVVDIYNDTSIRLLGINTPEKGELYYSEAKEFLENLILNKTIKLEYGKEKYDKYKRVLAYVHLNNQNINSKLIEGGFANYYFPSGKDNYYNEFVNAMNKCLENNKNLCEQSKDLCSNCIELKEFNYKSQEIIFYNKCDYDCELNDWIVTGEGRKKFVFENYILNKNQEVIVNTSEALSSYGGIFLRDSEGKLVLWEENY